MQKRRTGILIKNADWVITMDKDRRLVRNCTIAIDDTHISKVGKAEDFKDYTSSVTIDGRNKLVTPGLIDCHTHAQGGVWKGLGRNQQRCRMWIDKFLNRAPFNLYVNPDDVYIQTAAQIIGRLKTGTTCLADAATSPFCTEQVVKAFEVIGSRGIICTNILDSYQWPDVFPEDYRETTEKCLSRVEDFIKKWNGSAEGRIHVWPMPTHPAVSASDALLKGAKGIAQRYGVGLHMHACIDDDWNIGSIDRWGLPDIKRFNKLGILGPEVMLIHMSSVTDEDIDVLKETKTNVVQCPSASQSLLYGGISKGKFPEIIHAGINVALGSDSDMNVTDLIRNMYITLAMHEEVRRQPDVLTPETVMDMGTINGAKALLLDNEIGSIEPGKKADIAIFDLQGFEWIPLHRYNLLHNLIYYAQGRSVETVIVDGKIILENGVIKTINEGEIFEGLQKLAEKLVDFAERSGFYGHPWLVETPWKVV
jgi:5-methylthioadenosine/S-adenosylhomocysteine deaminase